MTIGELINYLGTFPQDWLIGIPDFHSTEPGICRETVYVELTPISTVLTSKGPEVEW